MTEIEIEEVALDLKNIVIGALIGEGAIPLYGRETRKEPCRCCESDGKQLCSTNDAIGMLSQQEVKEWCSEIIPVPDGRCERAKTIREAAKKCREQHPSDTKAFVQCYAPAFSKITRGSNPPEAGQSIAKQLGVRFDGIQEGIGMQFTDPQTGSTTYGNTLEEVETNLAEMRAKFAKAIIVTPKVLSGEVFPISAAEAVGAFPLTLASGKIVSVKIYPGGVVPISIQEPAIPKAEAGMPTNPGEMTKMPRINPHATAIQQDKQTIEQIKWLKAHGFKAARNAQEAGY